MTGFTSHMKDDHDIFNDIEAVLSLKFMNKSEKIKLHHLIKPRIIDFLRNGQLNVIGNIFKNSRDIECGGVEIEEVSRMKEITGQSEKSREDVMGDIINDKTIDEGESEIVIQKLSAIQEILMAEDSKYDDDDCHDEDEENLQETVSFEKDFISKIRKAFGVSKDGRKRDEEDQPHSGDNGKEDNFEGHVNAEKDTLAKPQKHPNMSNIMAVKAEEKSDTPSVDLSIESDTPPVDPSIESDTPPVDPSIESDIPPVDPSIESPSPSCQFCRLC